MQITLENIKARCKEVGDCWEWQLQVNSRNGVPLWNLGKGKDKKKVSPKREAWKIVKGMDVPDGRVITNSHSCGNQKCCNPDHLVCVTKAERLRRTVKTGKLHTPATAAKIAKTKRAKSKLSQEAVDEFLFSNEPVPVLAAKHGITEAYGYMLRRGEHRKSMSNPFAGLGARA